MDYVLAPYTPTPLPSPTPMMTNTPSSSDYLDPVDPEVFDCTKPELYPPELDPIADVALPTWGQPTGSACFVIVPNLQPIIQSVEDFGIDLEALGLPELWGVQFCLDFYPLPRINLFGVNLPLGLFLVPFVAYVAIQIWRF